MVDESLEKLKRLSDVGVANLTLDSLQLYIEIGRPTGGFLRAVLENNLSESLGRADDVNGPLLKNIVQYLYWDAPSSCWGSPEKVRAWIRKGGLRGITSGQ